MFKKCAIKHFLRINKDEDDLTKASFQLNFVINSLSIISPLMEIVSSLTLNSYISLH